jgi:hypothetical protein
LSPGSPSPLAGPPTAETAFRLIRSFFVIIHNVAFLSCHNHVLEIELNQLNWNNFQSANVEAGHWCLARRPTRTSKQGENVERTVEKSLVLGDVAGSLPIVGGRALVRRPAIDILGGPAQRE